MDSPFALYNRKSLVLGTVVTMDAGVKEGRRLVSLLGVVTVPDDLPIQNLWQYPLGGPSHMMRLCYAEGVNREKQLTGIGASGILTSPIWRT